jgi:ATP-dependent Clp protease ATP-binding subunit ClpA
VFERFTEHARQVIVLAQEEARALGHNYIGTEHILLGLLREEKGVAAQVLDSLNITVDHVGAGLLQITERGKEPFASGAILPFTPWSEKVLELSEAEAFRLGHNYIGTEHILLGLVRENEGIASIILLKSGADPVTIRKEVMGTLFGPGDHVVPTERERRLLMAATAYPADDACSEIDLRDLLLSLTRDEKMAPVLADLGIDEAAIGVAIERHPLPEEPPEGSANA